MNQSIPTRTVVSFSAGVVAALLIALVFTHSWSAGAAPGDEDSTFVPITPCRLFDIRPAPFTVGSRTSPLGPGESYPVQVTGNQGECTGIPADAVGVALNVTVTGPTQNTHIAVVPGDVPGDPGVSSLNVVAGQAPFPNKVDTKLSADGKIRVFNFAGSAYVLADIVGYYTNSTLKELVATRPFARHVSGNQSNVALTTTAVTLRSLEITAPIDGAVIALSTAPIDTGTAGTVQCSVSDDAAIDADYNQYLSGDDEYGVLTGQRAFAMTAGQTQTINLVCRTTSGSAVAFDSTLTATFYAGDGASALTESFIDSVGEPSEPAPAAPSGEGDE